MLTMQVYSIHLLLLHYDFSLWLIKVGTYLNGIFKDLKVSFLLGSSQHNLGDSSIIFCKGK